MPAYIHYRKYDQNLEPATKGGATISIEYVDDLRQTIVVAVSECSKHDNFNRMVGRMNADDRMMMFKEGSQPRFVYVFPRIKGLGLKENASYFMTPYFETKGMS